METQPVKKLSFWALTAMVTGSMLDAGIFSLPTTFARATGVVGAVIAWVIAGGGMLMLAFIFQNLATRKPELEAGPFGYTRDGFGNYLSFLAAFGFWAGACVGSVSYFVLIKSTLRVFMPPFIYENLPLVAALASLGIWAGHFIIGRGMSGASFINSLATFFKVVIVIIFVFFVFGAFQESIFYRNLWGGGPLVPLTPAEGLELDAYGYAGHAAKSWSSLSSDTLFEQVRRTMLVASYVFIGVEGASIYSRHARRKQDVGWATVIGFLAVLFLFMTVTLVSFGVLERQELASLSQPSMASILQTLERWRGAFFIRVGLIVTVLGAFLVWALFAVEVIFVAAKHGVLPRILTKTNGQGTPTAALWATTLMIQLFLLISYFSDYAYGFVLEMASALSIIPYLLVAAYAFNLGRTKQTYTGHPRKRIADMVIAGVAIIYLLTVFYSGGIKYILLTSLIYAVGTTLFIVARRERGLVIFTGAEKNVFILTFFLALAAVLALGAGRLVI